MAKNHKSKFRCLTCECDIDGKKTQLSNPTGDDTILLHKSRRQTHCMCYECFLTFIQIELEKMQVSKKYNTSVKCPGGMNCRKDNVCKKIIPLKKFIHIEELGLTIQKVILLQNSFFIECPSCKEIMEIDNQYDFNTNCVYCHVNFCRECNATPYHKYMNCKTYRQEISDELKLQIRDGKYRICPTCFNAVERIDGCNKMTCRCNTKWCWLCGTKDIDYDHFDLKTCPLYNEKI